MASAGASLSTVHHHPFCSSMTDFAFSRGEKIHSIWSEDIVIKAVARIAVGCSIIKFQLKSKEYHLSRLAIFISSTIPRYASSTCLFFF